MTHLKSSASAAAAGALPLTALGLHAGYGVLALARLVVLGAALGAFVFYDLRERRIPNRIVVPAIVACAILSAVEGIGGESTVGAAVLVAAIFGVALARPRWIAPGDAKLALLLLAGLHGATAVALLYGTELAVVVAVVLAMRHGRAVFKSALPFAPFVAAGSVLALLL